MIKQIKNWFQSKKDLLIKIDTLTIENNDLTEKNKKCQENINKTNSFWKSKMKLKNGGKGS